MVKRCPGTKVDGEWTGFICVLDAGHPERFCRPYIPPDADEWRALKARAMELEVRLGDWSIRAQSAEIELAAALDREKHTDATCARLQAELDALRAVVESGALSAIQAADMLAKVRDNAYAWPYGVAWACKEAHRLLTGGPPDGVYVKVQRDDLAGLARKGDA